MLGQKAPVPLGLIEDEMNVRVLIFRYNELFEQDSAQLTEVWREEERMCSGRWCGDERASPWQPDAATGARSAPEIDTGAGAQSH